METYISLKIFVILAITSVLIGVVTGIIASYFLKKLNNSSQFVIKEVQQSEEYKSFLENNPIDKDE